MLIRSKLHRSGGTRVTLGKGKDARHYHFLPADPKADVDNPAVEHVCDVADADDIATFVAIKEGYEIHASAIDGKAGKKAAAKAPAAAKASVPVQVTATGGTPPNYQGLKKPDLIKLVAERTGKTPHFTTPIGKLVEQLQGLDAQAAK